MKKTITCPDCGKRHQHHIARRDNIELCNVCNEIAEWENTHSDEAHGYDDDCPPNPACPACMDEGLVPDTRKAKPAGHGKGGNTAGRVKLPTTTVSKSVGTTAVAGGVEAGHFLHHPVTGELVAVIRTEQLATRSRIWVAPVDAIIDREGNWTGDRELATEVIVAMRYVVLDFS